MSETESIRKVREYLDAAGFAKIEIKCTQDTIFTVEDAARAVGAPARQILKSLMFLADKGAGPQPVLVLMCGENRVDLRAISNALETKKIKMASPEFVFDYSGFRIGGVPPVGYPDRLPALLDEDLYEQPVLWAAAGTEHSFFPVTASELEILTGGVKTPVKKRISQVP
jgi:prolyl-tRNA editing enzyme YbaK/EbsC (Cys-tRNA(Pro) deacylase)